MSNNMPYDEDREGGTRLNKGLIVVCLIAIGYSIYEILIIALSPASKDDLYIFLFSCGGIVGGCYVMRHSYRNLNKIKQERSWRTR